MLQCCLFGNKRFSHLVNGSSSLSKKKATVKSLTSKRLSDFLDASNNSIKDLENREVSSQVAASKPKIEKYSIIDLEPVMFGTNEMVDEAPLLFVGKTNVNPTENLQDIIESYKIFREISEIEDKEFEEQFRFVFIPCRQDDFWVIVFLYTATKRSFR